MDDTRIGLRAAACAAAAWLAASAPGHADPLNLRGVPDDEWRFSAMPYAFLPVVTSGTSTVDGRSADVDMDLEDVFDVLDLALAGRFEAWRGEFGLALDAYYTKISPEGSATGPGGNVTLGVDVVTRQAIVDLVGAWRFHEGVYGAHDLRYAFDAQAGARFNSLEQSIDARFDLSGRPGPQFALGGTETWWEPVIGLRGVVQIGERSTLTARADLSGFGVSGDDLQYRIIGTFDYRATERLWLNGGWMLYGIDYATDRPDGRFAYDIFQTGPFLGLTVVF